MGIDINELLLLKDGDAYTPIHYLFLNKNVNIEIIKFILNIDGININELLVLENKYNGCTALHYLFIDKNVNIEIIKFILAIDGININELLALKDKFGCTPLHHLF